ncbi:MAG: hypothetical protein HKN33_13425 [Pyrinomonadaceae bacterium]|nr:hypothetical protein [Pyrinomonadaceae bacterium]
MKNNKHTNYYVTSIIQDIQTRFVAEETTKFSLSQIERTYEFDDGAIVKYEWQDKSVVTDEDSYNHRFTMARPPKPNPHKLKKGVIKIIEYPEGGR